MNEKNVKIIIGANYGDEGKGLLTRYFVKQAKNPIVVFHNGTAQRGHTVDYNPSFRHVYHHFGCGTGDGAPTYFADTFWIHPMEFRREWNELVASGIFPRCYCDANARVVTPFDMLVDHTTEAYITWDHQEPEHGSCGYGTWCATDRFNGHYTIGEYKKAIENHTVDDLLEDAWFHCVSELVFREVDIDKVPEFIKYFSDPVVKETTKLHFIDDLKFFFKQVAFINFNTIYNHYDDIIFENGQGLGLDQNCGSEWHTTSNTGLTNPTAMLKNKDNFNAEICYVTRSYATRHGIGDMYNEAPKDEINENMFDRTNITNEFQGSLRYGYPEAAAMVRRIEKDFSIVATDNHFKKSLAVTHCNEFPNFEKDATYESNNPYSVLHR